jgi:hypothetical protein
MQAESSVSYSPVALLPMQPAPRYVCIYIHMYMYEVREREGGVL